MKTTVEQLDGTQKKVTIEIDAEEVDSRINKQYKDFAYRYNFPGFRKGKAPRQVVDNVLGAEAVRATVTDDVINSLYPLAMDEQDILVVGRPEFEDSEALVESGKPFAFVVTVETRPELELSSYDKLKVELPSTEATDEEIDGQVDELLNYYYDFEDAPANTKIKEGGFVEIGIKATNEDGEDLEAINTESRLYELGMGLFPPEFDEALIGLKKGESATVAIGPESPSMMMQNLAKDAGTVTFNVDVKQVKKRIVPELTDEWVKDKAGFDSVKDLRDRMADQIKMQKEQMLPTIRENETLYVLQERLQGEVPPAILEAQEAELLQNFFNQLQQSGMSFDMFLLQNGMSPDTFKDDLKQQAEDVAKQDLALDAWARHANIQITDEAISQEFANSGAEDPQALEQEWRDAGRLVMLRAGMKRTEAIKQIIDDMEVVQLAPGEKLRSVRDREAAKEAAAKEAEKAAKKDAKKAEKKDKAAEDAEEKPQKGTAKKASSPKKSSKEDAADATDPAADAAENDA